MLFAKSKVFPLFFHVFLYNSKVFSCSFHSSIQNYPNLLFPGWVWLPGLLILFTSTCNDSLDAVTRNGTSQSSWGKKFGLLQNCQKNPQNLKKKTSNFPLSTKLYQRRKQGCPACKVATIFDFWWQFPEGFLAGGKEAESSLPEAEEDTQVPQLVLALTIS